MWEGATKPEGFCAWRVLSDGCWQRSDEGMHFAALLVPSRKCALSSGGLFESTLWMRTQRRMSQHSVQANEQLVHSSAKDGGSATILKIVRQRYDI